MTDNVKTKISNAARKLFASQGLKRTTIEKIAKAAGIGKGTVYNYFESKEEVFSEVIHQEGMVLYSFIDAAVRHERTTSKKIKVYILTKITKIKELMNLYKVTRKRFIDMSDAVKHEMRFLYERERLLVKDILSEGVRKGEIEVKNISLVATALISALKDLENPWILDEDLKDVNTHVDVLIDILFLGLVPR